MDFLKPEVRDKAKLAAIQNLYGEIMDLLGIPETEDNADTPKRVAKALWEMTDTLRKPLDDLIDNCTTFKNTAPGVYVEQDEIEFSSMCSHHHMPFFGKVRIRYKAGETVIGLSKFKRIVDHFANMPQIQENLTFEITAFLQLHLDAEYVKVEVYDCIHTCMCSRGVKSAAKTSTISEINKRQ